MRRETEGNDVMILTIGIKIDRQMAFMSKHSITTLCPRSSMLVKVLNPIQVRLVVCPPIGCCLTAHGLGRSPSVHKARSTRPRVEVPFSKHLVPWRALDARRKAIIRR